MKTNLSLIVFALCLFFASCQDDELMPEKLRIRVVNNSQYGMNDITLNTRVYGDLSPGETSEYVVFNEPVSAYFLDLSLADENYSFGAIGEVVLEKEDYTAEIQVMNLSEGQYGALYMSVTKD